jgi:hypothetical protein
MAHLVEVSFFDNMRISDLSDLGLPICLPSPVRLNLGPVVAEGSIQAVFTSKKLSEEFANTSGASFENFSLSTRIFDFPLKQSDEVIVRTADRGLPLVVRRDRDTIVNFDIKATELFWFTDSPRPIYTYIPGFNIHAVPEGSDARYQMWSNHSGSLGASMCRAATGVCHLPVSSLLFFS